MSVEEEGVAAPKKKTDGDGQDSNGWKKTQFDGNFSVISSNQRPLLLVNLWLTLVRRAAQPADAAEVRLTLLDWSACP